jgi:D-alanyl-lipoteichoic acid acyltransferase DltB (MBOAT superfamily)
VFELFDRLLPTALPALLFLVWLPIFLLLPARHSTAFLTVAGLVTLVAVGGPRLAVGLVIAILLGYGLVESIGGLRVGRRAAFVVAGVLVHLGYWACFRLPLPASFRAPTLRVEDGPGVFVLFSGIGLTFFRLVSYLADRARGRTPRLPLADFLAYMLYFPQFRHGPIERGHVFANRLRQAGQGWSPRDLYAGLLRTGLGLAALPVAFGLAAACVRSFPQRFHSQPLAVLAAPEELNLPQVLLLLHVPAVFLYLLESSFASIQLGVSRVFGVRGSENFRHPFLASDPRDVWRRWNITLSHWLRDYAYIPLGGQARRRHFNVLVTFVYCGLLHGLQPRCLAWGLWTGGSMAAYLWIRDWLEPRLARRAALRHAGLPLTEPRPVKGLRVPLAILSRLATFHWFCLGVTIMLDPQHCGYRVLRHYVHLISGGLC